MCACCAHQSSSTWADTGSLAADPGAAAWIRTKLAAWLQAMRPHTLAESLTSPTLSGTCPAFLVRLPAAVGSCGAAALPAFGSAVHESGQLCGLCCSALCCHASPCKRHCHRGGCNAVPNMRTAPHWGIPRSALEAPSTVSADLVSHSWLRLSKDDCSTSTAWSA